MQEGLVERARAGDSVAFAALVGPQLEHLARIAAGIVLDPDVAADVVQDTLLVAWRQLPSLREPTAFGAWIRKILVNRSRNAIRDRRAASRLDGVDEPPDPRSTLESAVDRIDLVRALGALAPEDRVLLALFYGDDRSIDTISLLLGIPTGTVKSRLYAARRRLRDQLGGST